MAKRQRHRFVATRPTRSGARTQPAARRAHGPGGRFGRRTVDAQGRDRRGGTGTDPVHRDRRPLRVAGRSGLRASSVGRAALRIRRSRGETIMTAPRSDALVLFGATGDLAYKKIFPALQAMVKDGTLTV